MHTSKLRFSRSSIEGIPPQAKGVYYFDTEVSGLALRVLPSGFKTYYLYKRLKGKNYRLKIGSAADLSVEKARELARQYKEEIVSDKKIHQVIIDNKALTLLEMYHFFMNTKRPYLAESTYREYQKLWNEHCQKIGKKPAKDINSSDLKDLHYHLTVENETPYAANRVIVLLKSIFNLCIREGLFEQFNPCLSVKLNKELPRIRALSDEEIKRFLDAVQTHSDIQSRSAALLMLYTGARKSNVLGMKWADIDLKKGVWIIPKTKTSRNEPIALVPQAIEVLKEMEKESFNQYVFSSKSRSGHLTRFDENWKIMLKKAGKKNLRLHDLRHTLATRLIACGVSTFAVKKILTHKSIQSTQIYVNLGVEDVRGDLTRTINKLTERK